jgi:hypothetical protein
MGANGQQFVVGRCFRVGFCGPHTATVTYGCAAVICRVAVPPAHRRRVKPACRISIDYFLTGFDANRYRASLCLLIRPMQSIGK